MRVEIEDGKYTYQFHPDGRSEVLRHGEPWRDTVGDKFIYCMASEIEQLRQRVDALVKERDATYKIADHYRTSRDQSLLQYENQQAALILAKEALEHCEGVFDEVRGYPVTYDLVIEALVEVNKVIDK